MVSGKVQLNINTLKQKYFGHKTVLDDLLSASISHLFRS